MYLMSTSYLLCGNLLIFNRKSCCLGKTVRVKDCLLSNSGVGVSCHRGRSRPRGLSIPNAKKDHNRHSRKKSWWRKFFFDEEGNWLGMREEDMVEAEEIGTSGSEGEEVGLSEKEKFEEWKNRAEAIIELRKAQEDMRNEESRNWEDWIILPDETNGAGYEWGSAVEDSGEDMRADPSKMMPERGLVETVRDLVLGREDDDMLYEDRVFGYASLKSAKFLAVLIIIPLALDFLVRDYVLMPFLDRYVKTVPLAAEMLDLRRSQKLEMIKELKVERARIRFEVEIGKSPPLSDEEMWLELRHKALELRDERRLENRRAFANIWSDMVFGISLFLILYFNQSEVALLKFTGYKILNNISDTGKAFLIILITDIFLGYHSESGWQTVCEIIVEHYGFEVDEAAITIFISLVPVIIDACVKLWLFKFLPRLSPKVSTIFREMKRH
ncbi:hypothetical protein Nepgr_012558 [Nepenthes gracilis]|uniref:Chloroplast envelope membrane protein n=1 Tax=Nepenthes gracilis TaxID=150966 RepID=A0AAD3SGB8_NEPGR|nr:hypothetical protein Nepgr_012558 [Nepenthes gracilis]